MIAVGATIRLIILVALPLDESTLGSNTTDAVGPLVGILFALSAVSPTGKGFNT